MLDRMIDFHCRAHLEVIFLTAADFSSKVWSLDVLFFSKSVSLPSPLLLMGLSSWTLELVRSRSFNRMKGYPTGTSAAAQA